MDPTIEAFVPVNADPIHKFLEIPAPPKVIIDPVTTEVDVVAPDTEI